MLPETDVARIRRWVRAHNESMPEQVRQEVRYELDIANRFVTLVECRPPWKPELGPDWTRFPIVRFHYTAARREWATFWCDRDLKFHRYELIAASNQIEVILASVDNDGSGLFWG